MSGRARIALFVPTVDFGGAERVMLNLGEGFLAKGFEVDLVLATTAGPNLYSIPEGLNVVDLGVGRVVKTVPGLVRYLRRWQPDVMLSAMSHCNMAALAALRLAGVDTRLFVSEHNVEIDPKSGFWRYLTLPLRMVARRIYPAADAIIAVSGSVADSVAHYVSLPRDRIKVIYNPVVTPQLFERMHQLVEHPWFAPDAPPVLVNAGRLVAQKDQATLLRAFAQLSRRRAVRLLILGEGPLRAELEALARELGVAGNVGFLGYVDNPFAYMAKTSLFVLSSAWEGLPTVLIEAIACGCPVMSTDCPGGSREILEDGKWGRLVPVADPAAMAEAMAAGLDAPRPDYPLEAYERFTFDAVVRDYDALMSGNG